jgi:hypothetical protein
MGNPVAPKDRSVFLRNLAKEPAKALNQWVRLTQGEKLFVESNMKRFYGPEFVAAFHDRAINKRRPDESSEMINDPSMTVERLNRAGYRFKNNFGGTTRFVHASGKELWLLTPPKGIPGPTPAGPALHPPTAIPPSPDIEDSRTAVDMLEAERDELLEAAIKLKKLRTPDGYYPSALNNEYLNKLEKFEAKRDTILNEEAPLWGSALTPGEQEALQKNMDRLNALKDLGDEMNLSKP